MELTSSLLYWLITLPRVAEVMGIISACMVILFIFVFAIWIACEEKTTAKMARWFKSLIALPIVFSFLFIGTFFVPNTNELVAIYAIPAMANNEKVQNIGAKGLEVIELRLDQWIDSLKPKEEITNGSN